MQILLIHEVQVKVLDVQGEKAFKFVLVNTEESTIKELLNYQIPIHWGPSTLFQHIL